MSVAFSLAAQDADVAGWHLVCGAEGRLNGNPVSYREANLISVVHRAACTESGCRTAGPARELAYVHPDLATVVTMPASSAAAILAAIGVSPAERDTSTGSMNATAFKGALLLALALADTDDRLVQLLDVAEAAVRQNRDVCWA